MRITLVGLTLVGILTATPAHADLLTVDFNEFSRHFPPPPGELINDADYLHVYDSFVSSGVTITPTLGFIETIQTMFANSEREANLASLSRNGTGIMRAGGEVGGFELSTGGEFTLQSIDLLMGFDGGEVGASAVTFRGYRGGMLVREFGLPLLWHGTAGTGVPVGRTIGWTTADLRSLHAIDRLVVTGVPTTVPPPGVPPVHVGNSAEFWVDNVRVHQAPEPWTFGVFIVGVGALLGLRRSRARRD
jgi:hypothetical protein